MKIPKSNRHKWLLIFYTVPSKPVKNRMKIWRQLTHAGAVQLKGAVCILPYSEEHYEFFEWIISEVAAMGGDGGFVKVEAIETMNDDEIIRLFNAQRDVEYRKADKSLDDIELKLGSIRKGTPGEPDASLADEMARLTRDAESIKKRDFFGSKAGAAFARRVQALQRAIRDTPGHAKRGEKIPDRQIVARRREDYQGRTWVTRRRPFVDRMASAWLIRNWIDREAVFEFIDEQEIGNLGKSRVTFDIRDGEFTHVGDLCTMEVLIRSFGLKDKALRRIAELVHQLDLKDEKYHASEARGVEEILAGIRKTASDDSDALEKGMAVFQMLYASQK